ncbi:MAG: UvrB/UvrC motif-containing protein [bacterium]
MNSQDFKKINLPNDPGIYLFKKDKEIFYIGKATSLRDRIRSYFSNDLLATRGPLITDMVYQSDSIDFIKTDSVLEALILESNLIKKYQPKYNTKEKDDRSYNYVVITKEDFPRVLIERGKIIDFKNLTANNLKLKAIYGPFINGGQLKEALKIIRKIFPFRDRCKAYLEARLPSKNKACFDYQIRLCPGTCIGAISKEDYAKTIKNIKLFFEGRKINIVKNLEKEMKILAKNQEFEKADKIKKTIFALNHIQDIALIKEDISRTVLDKTFRIEAYDVAHISGTNTVGVMVVVENSVANKAEYRKFKINNSVQNDVAGLEEILQRRFNHPEWKFPDIIVVDGGTAQKNIAEKIIRKIQINANVVAVVKDKRHRPKMIQGREDIIQKYEREILLVNSEAHRFAIKYHREKRNKIL